MTLSSKAHAFFVYTGHSGSTEVDQEKKPYFTSENLPSMVSFDREAPHPHQREPLANHLMTTYRFHTNEFPKAIQKKIS